MYIIIYNQQKHSKKLSTPMLFSAFREKKLYEYKNYFIIQQRRNHKIANRNIFDYNTIIILNFDM